MTPTLDDLVQQCVKSNGSDYDMAHLMHSLLTESEVANKTDQKVLSNFLSTVVHDTFTAHVKAANDRVKQSPSPDAWERFQNYMDIVDKLRLKLKTRKSKSEIMNEYLTCF